MASFLRSERVRPTSAAARRGCLLLAALTLGAALALAAGRPASAAGIQPVRGRRGQPASRRRPGDAFYVPPSPLPPGNPGDIIWARSSASPVVTRRLADPVPVQHGDRRADRGLRHAHRPDGGLRRHPPGRRLRRGHPGLGDQCAPSKEIAAGDFDEQFAVSNLLDRGWAVVITDYPGLGTPGAEAYNVGIPEGYAVSTRAGRHPAVRAGLSAGAPMAIEGYSQGGGAADWAAQEQHLRARA